MVRCSICRIFRFIQVNKGYITLAFIKGLFYYQIEKINGKQMVYNWLYDRFGNPVAYFLLSGEIYAIDGRPLAYLVGFYVYSYTGRCIGFFVNGWLIDKTGFCALYTANAIGGPIKPVRRIHPIPCIRQIPPLKSIRQLPLPMPSLKLGWSTLASGITYFTA